MIEEEKCTVVQFSKNYSVHFVICTLCRKLFMDFTDFQSIESFVLLNLGCRWYTWLDSGRLNSSWLDSSRLDSRWLDIRRLDSRWLDSGILDSSLLDSSRFDSSVLVNSWLEMS